MQKHRRPIAVGLAVFLLIGAGYALALEGGRWVLSNRLSRLFSTPVQVKGFSFSLWNRSVTLRELTFDIAGVLLQAQGHLNVTAQAHAAARCEGWMNLQHPLLTGYLEVSGKSTEPVLLGWLAPPKGVQRRFLAQLSIRPEGMTLTQMEVEGRWRAWGVFVRPGPPSGPLAGAGASGGSMKGKFQVEGPGNRFTLEVEPSRRENGRLSLLLERKEDLPRRLTVYWALRRNALNFEAAFLGEAPRLARDIPRLAASQLKNLEEEARLSGRMELNAPHQMEITLELSGVEMEELFHPFFKRGVSPISGQMKGQVKVAGTPAHLISHGTLTSRDGKFYQTPFTWAAVRFSGVGPVLKIQNSQLTKPTGILLIEGSVDLRRLGHPDFFSQIRLSSVQNSLELAGWEISSTPGTPQGLQMRRSSTKGQAKVDLAYQRDTEIGSETLERQQVEVKYPLSSQEQVNVRINGQEEFLGVEHHRKF